MPTFSDFDVFLSHNSKDKELVRELKDVIRIQGLRAWFDDDEIRPGLNCQPVLERALQVSGSVVVAIGKWGLGPWEDEEMQTAINLAVVLGRPVIPVLLPGGPATIPPGTFLGNRRWIDFRGGYTPETIGKLVWGITGEKPPSTPQEAILSQPAPTQWVLVAGSGGATARPQCFPELCKLLGIELAEARFSLVTGGWDGVDHDVARSFAERIQKNGQSLSGRLVQVMRNGATPDFPSGRLVNKGSEDDAWHHSIERADAVVLIGGLGGTWQTGEWALNRGKLVFPLADTRDSKGGHDDAYKFYFSILEEWPRHPASMYLTKEQFEDLGNPSPEVVKDLVHILKLTLIR